MVKTICRCIVLACLNGGGRTPIDFVIGHVRVEKGTAIRSVFMYRALASEIPVAMTEIIAGRDQGGIGMVSPCAQVLLRPEEDILSGGA